MQTEIISVLKVYKSGMGGGGQRYVQLGRGVQQGRFLHLCRADPAEREEEIEEGGGEGGQGRQDKQIDINS